MTTFPVDTATTRQTVIDVLRRIAPEVSPDALQPAKPLRNQVDLDSMDWLNFIVALHEKFGVDIPEADYAKLVTLDDIIGYLASKL
jgi:acyl carrier protein